MTTRQTTIRLTEVTDRQLAELAELFGDRTKALTVAVDRLWQAEHGEVRTRIIPTDDHPSAIDVQWYIYAKERGNCLACYVRPAVEGSELCPQCEAETTEEQPADPPSTYTLKAETGFYELSDKEK